MTGVEKDAELVERYRQRAISEEELFTALVDLYYPLLLSEAKKAGIDQRDAEDIAHDALLKSFRYVQRYDAPTSFRSVMLSRFRHHVAQRMHSKLPSAALRAEPFQPITADPQVLDLKNALDSLTPEERELLVLRFWEGRTLTEIASSMNLSFSATASRVSRVMAKLRTLLGSQSGSAS